MAIREYVRPSAMQSVDQVEHATTTLGIPGVREPDQNIVASVRG
jgi:hypothetical protein